MRKLIAGMQMSVDGKVGGPEGYADWVDSWSDHYGVVPQVDACLLGGNMYGGYEQYWSAVQRGPDQPLPMTGRTPTPAEVEYGRFCAATPHYVLSKTRTAAAWQNTRLLSRVEEVAALKREAGKNIYLVGGARTVATMIDAGLVDELHLTFYPLIVGPGLALFGETRDRTALQLVSCEPLPGGLIHAVYALAR